MESFYTKKWARRNLASHKRVDLSQKEQRQTSPSLEVALDCFKLKVNVRTGDNSLVNFKQVNSL